MSIENPLTSLQPPWIHKVIWTVSEMTDMGWSWASVPDTVVRFLRGSKCLVLDQLFDEFAAALQFPYYFGDNWPAFSECLSDLSWLKGNAYILIIMDAERVLEDEESELEVFYRIALSVCEEWSRPIAQDESWDRPGKPFHIVLHASPENEEELGVRASAAGIDLVEL